MVSKLRTGRLVGGLIVVAIGAAFLLDSFDVLDIDIGDIFRWIASIGLIGFGLGTLVTQRFRHVFFPIVLILAGLFLLLGNLGVDASQYWPVILIVIGAGIIFGGSRRRTRGHRRNDRGNATTTREGEINVSCTLSETNERVDTSDFVGGTANVTMGNANLDLRDATVLNRPALLDVSVTMGGLNLRVPSDWLVTMDNEVTMAEAEDKRSRSGSVSDKPHLTITGRVTMGSLVIDD